MRFHKRMKIFRQLLVFLPAAFAMITAFGADKPGSKTDYIAYIGTYTSPKSKGIYAFRFHPSTGELIRLGLVAETVSPAFLAVDPTERFLYAANEINDFGGQKSGAVSAFAIDRSSGKLTFLNEVSSRGTGPCYVAVDKIGKNVLGANYDGRS